jgi:hypothetical protein
MSSTPADGALATSLAADPFSALAVHYGMLLGVPDFQVLMANPRGKLRLHQAWQHGPGVVWGYPVSVRPDSTELRVGPGVAVDVLGREVNLAVEHCVDVAQWLAAHADEVEVVERPGARTFNARVTLRYRACLTRPVPAMSSGCEGAGSDTAYSRVLETGELLLRPYGNDADGAPDPPPDDRDDAFPLLRALVREGRLPGTPADPPDPPATGWLQAFRTVAARETRQLAPPAYGPSPSATASRLFPEDKEIVLADLPGLELRDTPSGPRLTAPVVDHGVRRSHLPTWVIEELLAELAAGQAGATTDAGGPRVASIERTGTTVTVTLTGDVVAGTLAPAFSLHRFDAAAADPAWQPAAVDLTAAYTPAAAGPPATPARVVFELPEEPTASLTFRLVLRGTGETPLVGLAGNRPVAFAGRLGGPGGRAAEGHDVVELIT